MDWTFAMMIIMPMVVGCILPIVSLVCIWKTGPIFAWIVQWLGLVLVVPAVVVSELLLWSMIQGAYPTYLAHLFLLGALIIVFGQVALAVKTAV